MKRLVYIDNLKCLAIILVVVGHSIQYLGGGRNDIFFKIIYSFHMPLFIALSGYFFQSCLKLNFVELLKKKTITILWPAIVWSIPKMILSTGSVVDILIYNVWFLKAVYLCYLIYFVFYKIIKNELLIIFLIMIVCTFVPLEILPGGLNTMLPFFLMGILVRKYDMVIKKQNIMVDISLLILYIIMFYFCPTYITPCGPIAFYYGKISFDFTILYQYLYCMIIAAVAVLLLIRLFYRIKRNNTYVLFVGQSTLNLYLMNMLVSDIVSHMNIPSMNTFSFYVIVLLFSLLQILLFSYITKIINKNRVANLLLFGKS